jgi:hypothetical protein
MLSAFNTVSTQLNKAAKIKIGNRFSLGKTYKKIDQNMKNTRKTVSAASGIWIVDFLQGVPRLLQCKKSLMTFPSPAGMSLYKNSHPGVGRECRLDFLRCTGSRGAVSALPRPHTPASL